MATITCAFRYGNGIYLSVSQISVEAISREPIPWTNLTFATHIMNYVAILQTVGSFLYSRWSFYSGSQTLVT